MNSRQKRIEALGQRFSQDATPVKPQPVASANNNRKRHSIYIDADLMKRIDDLFRQIEHEVYPIAITKSLFLEKLLEKGIAELEAVKALLKP